MQFFLDEKLSIKLSNGEEIHGKVVRVQTSQCKNKSTLHTITVNIYENSNEPLSVPMGEVMRRMKPKEPNA